ncbi:MAG TPA: hypothetical protein VHK86_03225, partial [Nitrososphaera sp.]|nr:hypothetical protein [Nitrososphaera sp.]
MMVKTLAAIMTAILVVASAAGSFYFAGAQEQSHAIRGQAKITLGNDQAGSKVNVSGSDFNANSDVSIYFMSAAHADLTNGSALVLQEISADNNQSQTASTASNGSNDILGNALNTLRDMFGLGGNSNETNAASNNASSQGHLLAVLDTKLANGTVSLKCDNQDIAQGSLNGTSVVKLA